MGIEGADQPSLASTQSDQDLRELIASIINEYLYMENIDDSD